MGKDHFTKCARIAAWLTAVKRATKIRLIDHHRHRHDHGHGRRHLHHHNVAAAVDDDDYY